MAIRTTGELILVSEYNELATLVNKVFADNTNLLEYGATFSGAPLVIDNAEACNAVFGKHETDSSISGTGPFVLTPAVTSGDYIIVERNSTFTTSGFTIDYGASTITFSSPITSDRIVVYNRTDHRFGYGNQSAQVPLLIGEVVEANHINAVIDRTNIVLEHIGDITELTRKTTDNQVLAADGNLIEDTLNNDVINNGLYITMDPLTSTETTPTSETVSVIGWTDKVIGEYCFTFTSYAQARYFFNSASELHLDLAIVNNNIGLVGDRTEQWVSAVAQMSEVIMDHNSTFDVAGATYPGIGSNIGFYQLTDEYQSIYTSAAFGGSFDHNDEFNYTYTYHANLFVAVEAKYIKDEESGYFKVVFRITFDDTALNQDIAMNADISAIGFTKKTQPLTSETATLSIVSPYLEEVSPFTIS